MLAYIQIEDEKLKKVMEDLEKAKETIYDCYDKLKEMEILIVAPEKEE